MDKDYKDRLKQAAVDRETVPRQMYIKIEDLERLGYTVGCAGCKSILKGTTRQAHSEACRKRVLAEMGETDRAKKAEKKIYECSEKDGGGRRVKA